MTNSAAVESNPSSDSSSVPTLSAIDAPDFLAAVNFPADGLVAGIVQDVDTREILMIAWMNRDSLEQTLALGEAVFWSRSRGMIWHKGATSGNVQKVVELRLDCDGDAVLMLVKPAGPACHTGAVSCFFRQTRPENQ